MTQVVLSVQGRMILEELAQIQDFGGSTSLTERTGLTDIEVLLALEELASHGFIEHMPG